MATTIILGGKEFVIPELNFTAVERAWSWIAQAMYSSDPIQSANCGLHIVASGLMEADHFDAEAYGSSNERSEENILEDVVKFLKKTMKASDLKALGKGINAIVKEAGIIEENPPKAPATASPSTETSPPSLPSLSQQDVREEAGTE